MDISRPKFYFWILLDVLIGVAIFCGLFFGIPVLRRFASSLPSTRTMTVSAEGKATVTPDIAEATFSVVSRGKNPEELADNNNQKVSAAIEFLKSVVVADKDIKTVGYNLSPDYRYDPQTARNFITGYTLTQTVNVKIRDLKKVAGIIGGLTPLGINQIGGINFSIEDQEKILAAARSEAFERAQAKATEMASANHARLGRIINISESQGGVPIPYYFGAASLRSSEVAPAVASPTIEPGSQEVKDQVTLVYELE